jgi:glycosyltransferase involved in cell wall biosynthesis
MTAAPDTNASYALSVVIPCLNAEETIGEQLDALARQTWDQPWEVIVADNGSTDRTLAVVEEYRDRTLDLRVVDASRKPGAPFALNEGARVARGAALAFCDADDVVGEGWIAAMGTALAAHDLVAARQDATRLNPPWVREGRGEPAVARDLPRLPFPPYVPHAASCGLGVGRDLHEAIGGFDESTPILYDTDYCIRLQLAGAELHLASDAVVHYRYRSSFEGLYRQARSYAEHFALLQKRYAGDARIPGRWRLPLKGWKPILRSAAGIHRKAERVRLAWLIGWQVGRLRGSLRYRVLGAF